MGIGGLLLSLTLNNIPNLGVLRSLEPLEKVPGGGWWWCLNPILVFSLGQILNKPKEKEEKIVFGFPLHRG